MKTFLDFLKEADEAMGIDSMNTDDKNGENAEYEEQKAMGIEEEKEHSDIYKVFEDFAKENKLELPIDEEEYLTMIVEAHLKEDPQYYTKLKECFKPSDETEIVPVEDIE